MQEPGVAEDQHDAQRFTGYSSSSPSQDANSRNQLLTVENNNSQRWWPKQEFTPDEVRNPHQISSLKYRNHLGFHTQTNFPTFNKDDNDIKHLAPITADSAASTKRKQQTSSAKQQTAMQTYSKQLTENRRSAKQKFKVKIGRLSTELYGVGGVDDNKSLTISHSTTTF